MDQAQTPVLEAIISHQSELSRFHPYDHAVFLSAHSGLPNAQCQLTRFKFCL